MKRHPARTIMLAAGAFLAAAILSAAEIVPQIRKTDRKPFYGNGKRNEEVWWQKTDALTGFVQPQKASVEPFWSEAQLLFDDSNLYASFCGRFDPVLKADRNVKRGLFSDNHFELFIQPDPASGTYYQIAVSEAGLLYTAIGRAKTDLPGIKHKVYTGKDRWFANLTIPLASIGLKAPIEQQIIRANICRYNIDMPKNKEVQSSFAVLDAGMVLSYHLPDTWCKMILTSAAGKGVTVRAHSDALKFNILPDPGFDFITRPFKNPDIQRVETAPLSDIWLIRATGKSYHFHSAWVASLLEPGKEYTLRVRARRFGKEGSLGVVQLVRTPDKQYQQGGGVAWEIPLTEEFHEYYLPFKADKNVVSLPFYRIGARDNDSRIELENISLYEGRISAFEIRKVTRSGIKKKIAGTEIRLPENAYGKSPETLNVLVIANNMMALADPREIMTGLNVKADMLTVTGKNADVYYTDENPKEIFDRLKAGKYDLYMIGGRGVPEKIGKELAKQIEANVKRGAGLFLNAPAPYGNFAALVKNASVKAVGADHFMRQGLPVEFHVRPDQWRQWKHDPLADIREGTAEKGRVATAFTAFVHLPFQMRQSKNVYAYDLFPWSQFNKVWLARNMYYIANRLPQSFGTVKVTDGIAAVKCSGMPDGMKVFWQVTDKNGKNAASGETAVQNGSARVALPLDRMMNGRQVLTLKALNAQDETLDYTAATFEKAGPVLASLKDNKLFYQGRDQADLTAEIRNPEPGMTLDWKLEDFSGRVLESGKIAAAAQTRFKVPLAALYTNLGIVAVELKQNGKMIDTQRIPVIAQDRDRARLLNDYTVCVWNSGEEISPDFLSLADRQLEKIGFRSYLLPFRGMTELATGMGVGGHFRGGGDIFCGWPQKDNIRAQQTNTAAARADIARRAKRNAIEERQLGILFTAVCDEPNFVKPGSGRELDEHPENVAEFRHRMEAKYGSIANYNRRMATSYGSFSEVGPARMADARKNGKFGEFIEWRNFNTDRWCEVIKLVSDNAKAGDPAAGMSLYNSFGEGALGGNDYWKLLTKAGLDFSYEYTSMVYQGDHPIYKFDEYYRSFRPGLRVRGFIGYYYDRGKAFFQPWWFALHRYGGFTWFGAFAGIGSGGGGAWLNILDYSGALTEDGRNLQESLAKSNLLNGLGKLFLDYQWVPNDVAIYYSRDSVLLAFIRGRETLEGEIHADGPLHDLFYSRHDLYCLLETLLYQYDFLSQEQITDGKLKGRKTLFMPGVSAMSDKEIAAVKAFLANGGTVIADFAPGEYDEVGMKRNAAPFAGEKNVIVLGKRFSTKDAEQRKEVFRLLNQAGSKPVMTVREDLPGREAMHFADGNMHVFAIARSQVLSNDSAEQTFTFPVKGHVYDLRAGKYLGQTDTVKTAVLHGEASVWGVYPYTVKRMVIKAPESVPGGRDLNAVFEVVPGSGKPGKHVFHVDVVPPSGEARFFMKRNLTAENGKAELAFRIAENDPAGIWTLKVTDVLSGVSAQHKFEKK